MREAPVTSSEACSVGKTTLAANNMRKGVRAYSTAFKTYIILLSKQRLSDEVTMQGFPPELFYTLSTTVAYDLAPVVRALEPDLRGYAVEFVNYVLHEIEHHHVEGFSPLSLGEMVNEFQRQELAIQIIRDILRQFPLGSSGDHVVTCRIHNTFWITYLEHYYR